MRAISKNVSFLKILIAGIVGVLLSHTPIVIAAPTLSQKASTLIATAFTDKTLSTLRRGDRGRSVQMLQQILLDNGFLGAAGARLRSPKGVVADGIFGAVTESAIKDLQKRYNLPVTGVVNPHTWEVLDTQENPYRSPLPWKQ